MKALIVILGAGASGKSTLTRTLCGPDGKEDMVFYNIEGKAEKAKFALFPNGSAIAGNIKNGSDAIGNMEARALLIKDLLGNPSVQFVVTDGVRSSRKWDVDWVLAELNCAVIYVYLDITMEENLRRLVQRREAAGKTEMTPKTYQNMLAFRERAAGVWKGAQEATKHANPTRPIKLIRLSEGQTPGEWSREVKRTILRMFDLEAEREQKATLLARATSTAPAHV